MEWNKEKIKEIIVEGIAGNKGYCVDKNDMTPDKTLCVEGNDVGIIEGYKDEMYEDPEKTCILFSCMGQKYGVWISSRDLILG